MKKLFKGVLALVMVASLAACSSGDTTSEETTSTNDELVVGFVGPLEGNTSVYGIAVSNGGQLAIDDFNEANGTNFVLQKEDSKGDSTEAVNAYNKLVDDDGIVGLLGGVLSGESTAIGSSSQSVGTPIISASATAAGFTLTGSNVFRGCFIDPLQATAVANFSIDELSATTAAIIYDAGSDYSTGMAEVFTEVFEAAGGTVVEYEAYNSGDVDFNTQLTKISQANVDVVFSPNYYNDDYLIMKQAKDLGVTATFLGGDGWDGVLAIEGMDATVVEGAVFVNHYAPDDADVAEWLARYKDVFGVDPNAFSVLGYDSMNILLEAIYAAEDPTDSAAVVANMQATDYNGVLGHLVFDENGDPIKDLAYITVKDGSYVTYGK